MGLAAAGVCEGRCDCESAHVAVAGGGKNFGDGILCGKGSCWVFGIATRISARLRGGRAGKVAVCWHFRGEQRDGFVAVPLSHPVKMQSRALALVDRGPAAEIWKGEGRDAISAIGGAEEREKGGVLGNRKQLSAAKCPSSWSEGTGKYLDFTEKRFISHRM